MHVRKQCFIKKARSAIKLNVCPFTLQHMLSVDLAVCNRFSNDYTLSLHCMSRI